MCKHLLLRKAFNCHWLVSAMQIHRWQRKISVVAVVTIFRRPRIQCIILWKAKRFCNATWNSTLESCHVEENNNLCSEIITEELCANRAFHSMKLGTLTWGSSCPFHNSFWQMGALVLTKEQPSFHFIWERVINWQKWKMG